MDERGNGTYQNKARETINRRE